MGDVETIRAELPGFDCGRCGYSCDELAARIGVGAAQASDCEALADDSVELIINGAVVPLTEFPRGFLTGTVLGGVSALKGVGDVHTLQLRIVRTTEE